MGKKYFWPFNKNLTFHTFLWLTAWLRIIIALRVIFTRVLIIRFWQRLTFICRKFFILKIIEKILFFWKLKINRGVDTQNEYPRLESYIKIYLKNLTNISFCDFETRLWPACVQLIINSLVIWMCVERLLWWHSPDARSNLDLLQFQSFAADRDIYWNEILFLVPAVECLYKLFVNAVAVHFPLQIHLLMIRKKYLWLI